MLLAYGYTTHSTGTHGFEGTTRITLALGLVPVLVSVHSTGASGSTDASLQSVFYFRIKMLNSTAYRYVKQCHALLWLMWCLGKTR